MRGHLRGGECAMSNLRPGSDIAQVISDMTRADSPVTRMYGTIKHVGAQTVDVLLDGGSGLLQRKSYVGNPRKGDRVEVRVVDGAYVVYCPSR